MGALSALVGGSVGERRVVLVSGVLVAVNSMQVNRLGEFEYWFAMIKVTAIVAFIVVHVTLALLVPRSLLAMLTGGPAIDSDEAPSAAAPTVAEIKTIPEIKTVPEIETSR